MCDEGSAQALSREWKEKMSLSTTLRMYCAAHSNRFSERILFAGEHWSTQKLTKHTKRVIDLSHHLAQKTTQRQLDIHPVSIEKHVPICAINTEDNDIALFLFSKKNDSTATKP